MGRSVEHLPHHLISAPVELGQRAVVTSYGSTWRTVHRTGFRFKKRCSPPSRIVPTSPEGAHAGELIRAGLIRPGWSDIAAVGA
jgi:hypothetical protein